MARASIGDVKKHSKGVSRRTDDRPGAGVERRVDENGNARARPEGAKQVVIKRVLAAAHRLDPCGIIYVADCRDQGGLFRRNMVQEEHKRRGDAAGTEPFMGLFLHDNRRERPEVFPLLDPVESLLHVRPRGRRRVSSGCRGRAARTPSAPGTTRGPYPPPAGGQQQPQCHPASTRKGPRRAGRLSISAAEYSGPR